MAPPAWGTEEHRKYLDKQNDRRFKKRAAANKERKRKAAQPYVSAAVREVTKRLEQEKNTEVQKKNKLMRENNSLKYTNKQLLNTNKALEHELNKVKEQLRRTSSELTTTKEDKQNLQREWGSLWNRVKKWELWWQRLQERAGRALLSKLQWLGRPPRPAPDASWGGGQ